VLLTTPRPIGSGDVDGSGDVRHGGGRSGAPGNAEQGDKTNCNSHHAGWTLECVYGFHPRALYSPIAHQTALLHPTDTAGVWPVCAMSQRAPFLSVQRDADPSVRFDAADDATSSVVFSLLGGHYVERLRIDAKVRAMSKRAPSRTCRWSGTKEWTIGNSRIVTSTASGPRPGDPVDGSFSLSNSPSIGLDGRAQAELGAVDAHGRKGRRWSSGFSPHPMRQRAGVGL